MFMDQHQSQHKVWNNIASEWQEFKNEKPSQTVVEFLKNKNGNILDLGSGSGRHLLKLKNKNTVFFLVDFSEKMIELAKEKAEKQKINAEFEIIDLEKQKLPFKDSFFDSAISIAFLHCLNKKNHEKAIKELYRVMKPKAEALIIVWNKASKRFKNTGKEKYVGWRDKGKRYYYLFDENELIKLLEKVGFKIKEKLESNVNIALIVSK